MSLARLAALVLAACAAPAALAQHSHGVAKLDVAIEGSRLALELAAPMGDLVGFERDPRDAKERAAVEDALAFLGSGKAFVPAAGGGCRMDPPRVERISTGPGHAEAKASIAYACANAAGLAPVDAAGFFARFPKLKRVDVRMVTARGQSAARLTPARPALRP